MCRLRNIALRDYWTDTRTDRQTPDKVISMCRYAMQATQKGTVLIIILLVVLIILDNTSSLCDRVPSNQTTDLRINMYCCLCIVTFIAK